MLKKDKKNSSISSGKSLVGIDFSSKEDSKNILNFQRVAPRFKPVYPVSTAETLLLYGLFQEMAATKK